jgi:hypothetical protein
VTFTDIALLLNAIAAVGAVVASIRNGRKIEIVRLEVNSRMGQLLEVTGKAERAIGVKEGEENRRDWHPPPAK